MTESKYRPNGEYQTPKESRSDSRSRHGSSLTRSNDFFEGTHTFSRQAQSNSQWGTQYGNDNHLQGAEHIQRQSGAEWSGNRRRWNKHQSSDIGSPVGQRPAFSKEHQQYREKQVGDSSNQTHSRAKYTVKKREEAVAAAAADSGSQQPPGALEQPSSETEWPSLGGQQQQQQPPAANLRGPRPTRAAAAATAGGGGAAVSGASSSPARPARLQAAALPTSPLRLVAPSGHFADEAQEYLEPGNTNFAVVGVIGLQAAGKSSLLNALLSGHLPGRQPGGREFEVETLENLVENSHCTRGVQLQVTPERTLLLDCEALLALSSAEPLIQAAATERRGGVGGPSASSAASATAAAGAAASSSGGQSDFITVETGATMHSIQLSAFLMSVCHLLLVVQDGWPDPDLLRLLLTADMLRPAVLDDTDFQPRVVFVLNRVPAGAGPPPDQLRDLLAGLFEAAAFRLDPGDVFCLPLLDGSDESTIEYTEELERLRKFILTAPRYHMLQQDLFNEKVWLEFASQVWDSVQKSVMLAEYHRLIG